MSLDTSTDSFDKPTHEAASHAAKPLIIELCGGERSPVRLFF